MFGDVGSLGLGERLSSRAAGDTGLKITRILRRTRPGVAPAPMPAGEPDGIDRRRLRRAWLLGALVPLLLFTWVLTTGEWDFFQQQLFGDFYDAQARAFLDGRLDVPPDVVSIEGFVRDGKTYIYFGPLPALLRLPVLVVTTELDGQLTTLSLLGAVLVLSAASFRLMCGLRPVVRGAAPVGRGELWAVGGLSATVLLGPPLYLASGSVVYHEAIAWGLAFSVAAFGAVVRWQRSPSGRRLLIASALIAGGLLSRQSIAFGPLLALALAGLTSAVHGMRGVDDHRARAFARGGAAVALACAVPLVAAMAFNYAKLGTYVRPPMERQVFSLSSPERREVLEANEGFTGTEFVTTTARQYFRPDAIDFRRDLPWIDFPRFGPTLMNESARFDELDWSSSLPDTAPAATVLAIAGVVWSVRTRRRRGFEDRLLPLWLGALASGASVISFAYIANRYLNDLYPLVLVGGLVGFHALVAAAPAWKRWRRRAAIAGLTVAAVLGGSVNLALALEYQHERGPMATDSSFADWIDWRVGLPGAPEPQLIAVDDPLPAVADGALVVVGDCDGLYAGEWDRWRAVERGPAVGVYDVRLDLDDLPVNDRMPVGTFGWGDESTVVGIVRLDDGTVRVDVLHPAIFELDWRLGKPAELDGEVVIRLNADPRVQPSNTMSGDLILNTEGLLLDRMTLGAAPPRDGVAARYPGDVEPAPVEPDVCRRVTGM